MYKISVIMELRTNLFFGNVVTKTFNWNYVCTKYYFGITASKKVKFGGLEVHTINFVIGNV